MARKNKSAQTTSSIKGKLLEMLVAELHEAPNVNVARNVKLPSLRDLKRKREFDILVSGLFSGYPVRIAIECKNHRNVLDIKHIDAFIGKLQDVGIPTQQGIYVSSVGFTTGAMERANEVGITPLLFAGLTPDHLSLKIDEAIQSVVYLLAEITSLSIECNIQKIDNSFQLWFLYDQGKNIQGAIPDFVWKMWIEGKIIPDIGEQEINVGIPQELQLYDGYRFEPVISAKAKIRVKALHISVQGKATQQALVNPRDHKISRFQTSVSFDIKQKTFPITTFETESRLQDFLDQRTAKVKLSIGRILLPRIRFYSLYWPLSERAVYTFANLAIQCQTERRKATDEEMASIEGADLKTMWDPIWFQNPIIKGQP